MPDYFIADALIAGGEFKCVAKNAYLKETIAAVARSIKRHYDERIGESGTLLFIGVLDGAYMFFTELTSYFGPDTEVGFCKASSYHGGTSSTGALDLSVLPDVTGRHVVLVDDVWDTGLTMKTLVQKCQMNGAASVSTAVLVNKSMSTAGPDFYALSMAPDDFIVGYGMDYKGKGRTLPDLYVKSSD